MAHTKKPKSILIIGASNSGKSTTIREVCINLEPTKVSRLDYENRELVDSTAEEIYNDTFIIEVKGKSILVVAGAPTEQKIKLKILIEFCIDIEIDISFILASRRLFEKTEGFDTFTDLDNKSEILLSQTIHRIENENFMQEKEWKDRVDSIVSLIQTNI